MELKDSHRYDVPADAVIDMFADRDAITARYEGMGHRDVEILAVDRGDGSLEVRTKRVVDVDLPGFARKVLQPTNTMTQDDTWTRRDDGSWDGSFTVDVAGAPVELSGKMRLMPDGDACTHEVAITMNVKVPLVGGKIADWVGKNDARQTLAAEFAAGDAWLAEHPPA